MQVSLEARIDQYVLFLGVFVSMFILLLSWVGLACFGQLNIYLKRKFIILNLLLVLITILPPDFLIQLFVLTILFIIFEIFLLFSYIFICLKNKFIGESRIRTYDE